MRRLGPFIPAIVLLLGCGSILQTRSQRKVELAVPVTAIQPDYGAYDMKDQVLSKDEIAVAGMTQYAARVYSRDTLIAFTTLVSYYDRQTQGRSIHSPKNCLPGAGWEVLTPGIRDLHVGSATYVVNHYVLKKDNLTAVVYYWYQGRGRVVANEYAVKWNLLRDAALKGHTEEALVRVVIPVATSPNGATASVGDNALKTADALGEQVAAKLLSSVDRVLPKA
jgi:EpsI family protein